jgi:hypothetical protein
LHCVIVLYKYYYPLVTILTNPFKAQPLFVVNDKVVPLADIEENVTPPLTTLLKFDAVHPEYDLAYPHENALFVEVPLIASNSQKTASDTFVKFICGKAVDKSKV